MTLFVIVVYCAHVFINLDYCRRWNFKEKIKWIRHIGITYIYIYIFFFYKISLDIHPRQAQKINSRLPCLNLLRRKGVGHFWAVCPNPLHRKHLIFFRPRIAMEKFSSRNLKRTPKNSLKMLIYVLSSVEGQTGDLCPCPRHL